MAGFGLGGVLSFLYLGPVVCGTGGCPLRVLAPDGAGYRLVAEVSVVRVPVRVAATSSNGWRDLIVGIGGGGLPAGNARLRHDGTAYPSNPTVPPSAPVADTADAIVLIPEFGMYTEGKPLSVNEVRQ